MTADCLAWQPSQKVTRLQWRLVSPLWPRHVHIKNTKYQRTLKLNNINIIKLMWHKMIVIGVHKHMILMSKMMVKITNHSSYHFISIDPFWQLPSGKRLHDYGKSPCVFHGYINYFYGHHPIPASWLDLEALVRWATGSASPEAPGEKPLETGWNC